MCQRCLKAKPDRCHHCSQCNKCILKMDHHCPWVCNCIGYFNYKYFLNMLFNTAFACDLVALTTLPIVREVMESKEDNLGQLLYILVSYFLVTSLGIIISGFFCFHIYLLTNAKTTIEYCEKKETVDARGNRIWDLGKQENLYAVIGNNILGISIPWEPTHLRDGLTFDVNPRYN